jgi:integrase
MPDDKSADQNAKTKKKSQKSEPIKTLKDVREIIKRLEYQPRNRLLFVIGVNTGLRIGTILKLKVGDAKKLLKASEKGFPYMPNSEIWRYVQINKQIVKELKAFLENKSLLKDLKDEDYLFRSKKGNEALTSKSVSPLIKKWTKEAGLKGNYGSKSLQKTFGYLQRTQYGVGFDVLSKIFGHEKPFNTMIFLGIAKDTPVSILKNKIG